MKHVKFRPWKGDNYENGFRGKKILVLGDSHYCKKECVVGGRCHPKCEYIKMINGTCDSMTVDLISKEYLEYRYGNLPTHNDRNERISYNYLKTLLCFERNVCGCSTSREDSFDFWHSIIFYNYKQHAQSSWNEARETTAVEYQEYRTAFEEVLEEYKPDYIIVWGKNSFSNEKTVAEIEYNNVYRAPKKEFSIIDGDTTRIIPALIVEHPSSANGKSRGKWHSILREFLELND